MSKFACITLVLLMLPSAWCQENDGGYRRQYEEAEKKLQPEKLSTEQLIRLLEDGQFFRRQVATRHLCQRVNQESFELMLETLFKGRPESRARMSSILRRHASQLCKAQAAQVKLEAEVSNPRFWKGNNQHLGGVFDQSLDSTIKLRIPADVRLKRIVNPLLVAEAKTDKGEAIGQQVWSSSLCDSSSFSLYLNRPTGAFRSVDARVLVVCDVEFGKVHQCPFKVGTHQLEKEKWWVTIEQLKQKGCFRITVTDMLGRLWTSKPPKALDGKQVAIEGLIAFRDTPGVYRASWEIDTSEHEMPAFLGFEEPQLRLALPVRVSVPHPPDK